MGYGWNQKNAVAPDWNLKSKCVSSGVSKMLNAVAPDWNLKVMGGQQAEETADKCSRTRLEFKVCLH